MNTARDRTREFIDIVQFSKSRSLSNGDVHPSGASHQQRRLLAQRSQFTLAAKQIGIDLHSTCTKLEKLSLLAKKQSLFNDRSSEISEMTYIVKQDIAALNKQIAALQDLTRSQCSGQSRQRSSHSSTVVMGLQTQLARMSNKFKGVLEERTETLKKQTERREMFSGAPPPSPASHASSGAVVPSLLLEDEERARTADPNHTVVNMNGHAVGGGDPHGTHRYQQQLAMIDETDAYLESRAETMHSIEHTIVELGEIFQQLAFMVKEQEESVHRIDANIEETSLNVEAAHSELLKYLRSVSSNRWLMIKVFGVLIVFFIIFVVLVA